MGRIERRKDRKRREGEKRKKEREKGDIVNQWGPTVTSSSWPEKELKVISSKNGCVSCFGGRRKGERGWVRKKK